MSTRNINEERREDIGFGLLIVDDEVVKKASRPFILLYRILKVPLLPKEDVFITPKKKEEFIRKLASFLTYDDGSLGYPSEDGIYYYLKGVRILIAHGSEEGIGTRDAFVSFEEIRKELEPRIEELDKNLGDLILLACESCKFVEKIPIEKLYERIVCFENPVRVDRRLILSTASLLLSNIAGSFYKYLKYAGVSVYKQGSKVEDIDREVREIAEKIRKMLSSA